MCGHPRFKEERGASAWCMLIDKKNSLFQRSIQLIFQTQNKQHAMHLWHHLIKGNLHQKGSNIKSKRKSDPEERVKEWNYGAGKALLALNEGSVGINVRSSVLHKWCSFRPGISSSHFLYWNFCVNWMWVVIQMTTDRCISATTNLFSSCIWWT